MKKAVISFFIFLLAACSRPTPEIISPTLEPESVVFSTATLQPTQTLWVTSTPGPTYTPNATKTEAAKATPTLDLMSLTEPWKTYTDKELGISFDYPAMFDDMDGCEIRSFEMSGLEEGPDEYDFMGYDEWTEIRIGKERFVIFVVDVGDTSLSDAVDRLHLSEWWVLTRLDVPVNGYDTIQIEFTYDRIHYDRMTFFKNDGKVFTVYTIMNPEN